MTTERETRDDDFDLAVDAMRTVDAPSSERAAAVRRAVIEAASQRKSARSSRRSQRKTITAAILLAAAFGGTAFAAVAAKTSLFARRAADTHTYSTPASSAAPRAPARRTITRDPIEPAAAQTAVIAAPEQSAPSRISAREPPAAPRARLHADTPIAPRVQRSTGQSAPGAVTPVTTATAATPEVDSLYHQAHEAHFVTRNPALALDRWNAYLSAEPSGRFVPEAQFNRVVCLVRLGRTQEALAAIDALPSSHYRHADALRLRAQLEPR